MDKYKKVLYDVLKFIIILLQRSSLSPLPQLFGDSQRVAIFFANFMARCLLLHD